ncbi:hypothetical protein PNO31109_00793 [Pandoraea nosoerga]|uniref:Uncharacterized protein n=1 Tax=Pandoraea nosoerga TaxID=2508296 RepID=A0A5E4SIR1_9BURK|nr:hypothetical protein PNO31109_00793 [Pandoraea nosoerga]
MTNFRHHATPVLRVALMGQSVALVKSKKQSLN